MATSPRNGLLARFSRLPLAHKFVTINLVVSLAGLVAAGVALVAHDTRQSRERLTRDVGLLADVVGSNTSGAVSFGDARAANETLRALVANQHVVFAEIATAGGQVLARYERGDNAEGAGRDDEVLMITRAIALDGQVIGTVRITSDLAELRERRVAYITTLAAVFGVALLASIWLTLRLQRAVSAPLQRLTEITRLVTTERQYQLRAEPAGEDDVGELVRGFNTMLSEIQAREAELRANRDALEATVEARTSELRAVNEQLTREHDRALTASNAKGEFLANMSHELRTPMNGIIGMTELALETQLTEEQREYLETVKSSAEALLTILNDVLDFSKIESGKVELDVTSFSIRDVVAHSIRPFAVAAHQKRIELIVDVADNVPQYIAGDAGRVRQVLMNLVANAVKFTPRGHVLVEVREAWRQGSVSSLHLNVSDTGIGIPRDKHRMVFEAFSQADGSTARRFGGTGLGLSISAHLVSLMNGRIWVESEEGQGSIFHVEVPFELAEAPVASSEPMRLPPVRVLVVDDHPINRRILLEQLTRWGADSEAAPGGEEALERANSALKDGRPFALVLLDLHMPGMDGFEVATRLLRTDGLERTPIAMLTSSGGATRAREVGIAVCLQKPFKSADLFAAIAPLVGRAPAWPPRVAPAPAKPQQAAFRRRVLVAEDNPVNQRLAAGLLKKRGHEVAVATNGLEALEAIERGGFDLVLMDLQMPGMSGLDVTAEVRRRESEAGGHLKIVAVTAHALAGDRERCLAAGMDGYLTKPIDPRKLFEAVEEEDSPAMKVEPDVETSVVFDRVEILRRLDNDEPLLLEIIDLYLEDSPNLLSEMEAAVDRGDVREVAAGAHRLKGAAGNLAAARLAEVARTLETLAHDNRVSQLAAAWDHVKQESRRLEDALRASRDTTAGATS